MVSRTGTCRQIGITPPITPRRFINVRCPLAYNATFLPAEKKRVARVHQASTHGPQLARSGTLPQLISRQRGGAQVWRSCVMRPPAHLLLRL